MNRASAEPPSKLRREGNKPETVDPAGEMLRRNPGVALVWVSQGFEIEQVHNGYLFNVGIPYEALWYAHGREATHEEVMASIDSGLPALLAALHLKGPLHNK